MRGTIYPINRAMMRPLMIGGVEKRLFFTNALLSFLLTASTHFKLPVMLIGVLFFLVVHFILVKVSKFDPMLGTLFKRSTRYSVRAYFPAISHPAMTEVFKVRSVSKPWG